MINYEKLEHKLTDCNMNAFLKDSRIKPYIKEHKDICPYLMRIKENYKCVASLHKDLKNYWHD